MSKSEVEIKAWFVVPTEALERSFEKVMNELAVECATAVEEDVERLLGEEVQVIAIARVVS